jgi:hypothetical protein
MLTLLRARHCRPGLAKPAPRRHRQRGRRAGHDDSDDTAYPSAGHAATPSATGPPRQPFDPARTLCLPAPGVTQPAPAAPGPSAAARTRPRRLLRQGAGNPARPRPPPADPGTPPPDPARHRPLSPGRQGRGRTGHAPRPAANRSPSAGGSPAAPHRSPSGHLQVPADAPHPDQAMERVPGPVAGVHRIGDRDPGDLPARRWRHSMRAGTIRHVGGLPLGSGSAGIPVSAGLIFAFMQHISPAGS